jgi:type II secretory pathway pseudopilin PulG
MSNRSRRPEAGFTLYEIVVAILLLGLAVHPLLSTLSSNTRISTDRQQRLDAQRVLMNEVALLAAADPATVPAERGYRADRTGRAAAGAPFRVRTRRTVRCGVGRGMADNAAAPPVLGCADGGAVADYSVSVTFPRAAASTDSGTITHRFSVAGSAVTGGTIGGLP